MNDLKNNHEEVIENCKFKMYDIFRKNHMKYFWKEEDIQSYLYSLLIQTRKFILKQDNEDVLLVHREYPTLLKYEYDTKRIFKIKKNGGNRSRGEIDLVIWDPNIDWRGYSPEYKIFCGIEIKFQRNFKDGSTRTTRNNFLKDFYPDYRKLHDPENKIEHKHILYFVKSNRGQLFKNIEEVESLLKEQRTQFELERQIILDEIKFSYLEVGKDSNPILVKNY